jgi:DNA repair protein RadC
MRIKDISLQDRPRERLEKHGPAALSDAELLALILKTGTKEENVIDVSHRLISTYGVDKLHKCTLNELQEIKGIGRAKASQIIALFEFNKRHSFSQPNGVLIKSPKQVYEYCYSKLNGLDKEHFMVLLLDTRGKIVKDEVVSVGTLNSALIHPREIFKSAIKESANSIILVHNHPSGDPNPSEEDRKITEMIVSAGELLSIKVLDHVIVGNGKWWSWKDGQNL